MDYVRGVAVLLVASGHFCDLHPFSYKTLNVIRSSLSFTGLPLFFVLSGFLLTRQMTFYTGRFSHLGKRHIWSLFFVNRILRIYPAYLVSLFILGIIGSYSLSDIMAHVFNIHNFFFGYVLSINPVYWTLAVEFQWYIAFPLLVFPFSKKKTFRAHIVILLFLIVLGFTWRQYFVFQFLAGAIDIHELSMLGHYQLISHLFGFCAGIALFYYVSNREGRNTTSSAYGSLFAGILLCFVGGLFTAWGLENPSLVYGIPLNIGTLFVIPGGAALVMYWMLRNEQKFYGPRKYFTNFIKWIGIISYSLYLWHTPILNLFQHTTGVMILDLVISFVPAIGLSWLSYIFVEKFFMKFKGSFLKRLSNKEEMKSVTDGTAKNVKECKE
jgi:peptidoglycan/LPS O-acetylase OafA/YrhL